MIPEKKKDRMSMGRATVSYGTHHQLHQDYDCATVTNDGFCGSSK